MLQAKLIFQDLFPSYLLEISQLFQNAFQWNTGQMNIYVVFFLIELLVFELLVLDI